MPAIVIHQFADPARLKVETVPTPEPSDGEVLVEVRAASINPSDIKNVAGAMHGTTLPRIPGRDFAGIVVKGAAELIGREVWGTGGDTGFTRDGSHAEYMTIPVDAAIAKPHSLTFEQAACVGVNFIAAYQGLVRCAQIQAGETLL